VSDALEAGESSRNFDQRILLVVTVIKSPLDLLDIDIWLSGTPERGFWTTTDVYPFFIITGSNLDVLETACAEVLRQHALTDGHAIKVNVKRRLKQPGFPTPQDVPAFARDGHLGRLIVTDVMSEDGLSLLPTIMFRLPDSGFPRLQG
jgi:hypothetical protein